MAPTRNLILYFTSICVISILLISYFEINNKRGSIHIRPEPNNIHRALQLVQNPLFHIPEKLSTRHAIIHIGPPKTATTSLQYFMTQDVESFVNDGYYTRGPFHELAYCLNFFAPTYVERCTPEVQKEVDDALNDANKNYQHLFISSEAFGDVKYATIATVLKPWDDITVVLNYRRFYEWLSSKYNQFFRTYKKPLHRGGDIFPSIAEYLTHDKVVSYYGQRYVTHYYDKFRAQYDRVHLFNIHDVERDVVADFYCDVVPDAPNACRSARRRAKRGNDATRELNRSEDLEYDRLARAAYHAGLLIEGLTVQNVMKAIKERLEDELGLTSYDLPQECVPEDTLDLILFLSLEAEKKLFPGWFATRNGEIDLREKFHKASNTKFCNVDVYEVLRDDAWREFFQSIQLPIIPTTNQ